MATKVEDLVQTTPADARVKIPERKERLPSRWRIKLVEDFQAAYPDLDRNIINMVMDFDEIQAQRFGKDYDPEEHLKDIFPALSSDSDEEGSKSGEHLAKKLKTVVEQDGEGEERETGDSQRSQAERSSSGVADASQPGELHEQSG